MRIEPFSGKARVMLFQASCLVLLLTLVVSSTTTPVLAQTPATDTSELNSATTQTEATALRDAFVTRLRNVGFRCSLAAPAVLVEDVPSFGQYRPETNVVRTSNWNLLSPAEKAMFAQLVGPGKQESDAQRLFEVAHQWIFIHELGHWWQACSGGNAGRSHYQAEYGANRIALAYWREVNPQVAETMKPVFQAVVDHATSPVPTGQSVEDYFNTNYETLGPSPKYPWFMSRMNLTAFDEMPVQTFAAALRSQQQPQ